jgi:serine/threonine protein kinase
VLDFGLAKAWEGPSAASADLSQSPTLAHTGTAAGLILGTAAYMSPGQARRRAVDKRAAVLKTDPDWTALPPDTPAGIRSLLRRCLDRDPRSRLRDIGEARVRLAPGESDPADPPARSARGIAPWVAIKVERRLSRLP